jgi:hypothetical protein
VALRHSPNQLRKRTSVLKWEGSSEKRLFLANGESSHLLIASFQLDHKIALGEMKIWALKDAKAESVESARWNTNSQEKLPEYDIRIWLFGDGYKSSKDQVFTVRPKRFFGPLEMVEPLQQGGLA